MNSCAHPDGIYLYEATDEEGNPLSVWRCTECGSRYVEGGW